MARLKSCPHCGRVHEDVSNCPNKLHVKKKEDTSKQRKFRDSTAWKRMRERIKERDKYCCRISLKKGKIVNHNLHVHHIIPLNVDWSKRLDPNNLITLCEEEHSNVHNGMYSQADLTDLVKEVPSI